MATTKGSNDVVPGAAAKAPGGDEKGVGVKIPGAAGPKQIQKRAAHSRGGPATSKRTTGKGPAQAGRAHGERYVCPLCYRACDLKLMEPLQCGRADVTCCRQCREDSAFVASQIGSSTVEAALPAILKGGGLNKVGSRPILMLLRQAPTVVPAPPKAVSVAVPAAAPSGGKAAGPAAPAATATPAAAPSNGGKAAGARLASPESATAAKPDPKGKGKAVVDTDSEEGGRSSASSSGGSVEDGESSVIPDFKDVSALPALVELPLLAEHTGADDASTSTAEGPAPASATGAGEVEHVAGGVDDTSGSLANVGAGSDVGAAVPAAVQTATPTRELPAPGEEEVPPVARGSLRWPCARLAAFRHDVVDIHRPDTEFEIHVTRSGFDISGGYELTPRQAMLGLFGLGADIHWWWYVALLATTVPMMLISLLGTGKLLRTVFSDEMSLGTQLMFLLASIVGDLILLRIMIWVASRGWFRAEIRVGRGLVPPPIVEGRMKDVRPKFACAQDLDQSLPGIGHIDGWGWDTSLYLTLTLCSRPAMELVYFAFCTPFAGLPYVHVDHATWAAVFLPILVAGGFMYSARLGGKRRSVSYVKTWLAMCVAQIGETTPDSVAAEHALAKCNTCSMLNVDSELYADLVVGTVEAYKAVRAAAKLGFCPGRPLLTPQQSAIVLTERDAL